ncbi:hypothetical protein M3O75_07450 [Klebsiella pneumoniae]|nr:hypothetical protein [Klebsiella pneumoniae]
MAAGSEPHLCRVAARAYPAYNPYHSNQSRFCSPDKARQAPHPGMQRR